MFLNDFERKFKFSVSAFWGRPSDRFFKGIQGNFNEPKRMHGNRNEFFLISR